MARQTDNSSTPASISGVVNTLFSSFSKRTNLWLDKRIPAASCVELDHRSIFILPSLQGLAFLFMLFTMFIAAVNYESSLAFALVFLLLSMFIVSMFYTYRNLAGLKFTATENDRVFAGSLATMKLSLESPENTAREGIQLGYTPEFSERCNLVKSLQTYARLKIKTSRRGLHKPGRLRVETSFPFGLFRSWSLLDLKNHYLVYPMPVACDLHSLVSATDTGKLNMHTGNDDFHDLKEYRPGDSLRHVAWKHYATGRGLYTKQFATHADDRLWLTWDLFEGMPVEDRLSRLCYCVLELDRMGAAYGLRIPGTELQPAKGQHHLDAVLEALALFGMAPATEEVASVKQGVREKAA